MSLSVSFTQSEKELVINSAIVYFTYAVIIVAVLSCIVIFSCRKPKRRRKGREGVDASQVGGQSRSTSSAKVTSKGSAEDAGVIQAEEGKANQNQLDQSQSFDSLFENGVKLTLHGPRGPLIVVVKLEGAMLLVQNSRPQNSRSITYDLKEVERVQRGARPATARMRSAAEIAAEVSTKRGRPAPAVIDEDCFTLVSSKSGNLDFQATSRIECEALIDGFERKLMEMRNVKSV